MSMSLPVKEGSTIKLSDCDIYDLLRMQQTGKDLYDNKLSKAVKENVSVRVDFLGDFGFELEKIATQYGIPFESKYVSECMECGKRLQPNWFFYWMGGTFCSKCMREIEQDLNQE
ncbi:hypothetical protein [Sporomusa sphaeroides]|nr:hypothetical protein [Sporomusa sphaeroides]